MKIPASDAIFELPLATTLFFPLSANPVGFNHFAAAEWMLRSVPRLERVVLIPSNGRHPDPTKADAEVEPEVRLEILRAAVAALSDPGVSHLARLAAQAGAELRCGGEGRLSVWEVEFAQPRAVPTAETVGRLREGNREKEAPINWFAGSDLLERMARPAIFSASDLTLLSATCRYLALERDGRLPEAAVEALRAARGVSLDVEAVAAGGAPRWLAPFLGLSSTHIRNAAEAGDPLEAMLPAPAAAIIGARTLYRPGRAVAQMMDRAGSAISSRSALQLSLEALARDLGTEASLLAEKLVAGALAGKPHTFSLAEASVGGFLTQALASRSGASRYFKQSRFAYDERAKRSLLGEQAGPGTAVSAQMATALASAMAREAETDFALAETGMAGPPDGQRRSMKNGLCHVALATPKGMHSASLQLPPFQTRKEHQLAFAIQALTWTRQWLTADGF